MNVAFNADCMEIMRGYSDKHFDLAVVDPPYGSGGGSLTMAPDLEDGSTDIPK